VEEAENDRIWRLAGVERAQALSIISVDGTHVHRVAVAQRERPLEPCELCADRSGYRPSSPWPRDDVLKVRLHVCHLFDLQPLAMCRIATSATVCSLPDEVLRFWYTVRCTQRDHEKVKMHHMCLSRTPQCRCPVQSEKGTFSQPDS
jgi:hypothetical protein